MEKSYTIYKITNKINGKAYIGFATDFKNRKASHLCEAFKRKNDQFPLYRALRKYGLESFDWIILETTKDRDYGIKVLEPKYIKEHNTHYIKGYGYNMTDGGEATFGWIPSEETRKKISMAKKGIKHIYSKEGMQSKVDFMKKHNPMFNEISYKKAMIKKKKEYILVDPNGKEYRIKGLIDFCRDRDLNPGCLSTVAKGKYTHHKGWTCKYLT